MDTSEALKLVPIPELSRDLLNFDEWKVAVWLHLSYHNLDCFVRENEDGHGSGVIVKREDDNAPAAAAPAISQDDRRRRLLAYSIIWSSAKEIIPFAERWFSKRLQRDDDQLDPKGLWQLLMAFHKARCPSQYA